MDGSYFSGFGNEIATEALPGALPEGQNTPQKCPYGLIAEQLSGSAFTAKRGENQRSWLYRVRPSVVAPAMSELALNDRWMSALPAGTTEDPNQMRWDPLPAPAKPCDFIESMFTVACSGSPSLRSGSSVHLYHATKGMEGRAFYNSDGEMLIVPQTGTLHIWTEMGLIEVSPGEISIIPRGVKISVSPDSSGSAVAGYVCENYGRVFTLPNLGPIGANGLANPRDFLIPKAAHRDGAGSWELITRYHGRFWGCSQAHNPFDVVAWHGNYYPYKYDLTRFNTINTVSFDHPDPSIFTVLTSPSAHEGVANIDFVIFPPRWMVGEHTFRPPYFHRNVMSEYMGLVYGVYDAKPAGGFSPGGGSLHNCMVPHGPETAAFVDGTREELVPKKQENTLAFMFESGSTYSPTPQAIEAPFRQKDYLRCWEGMPVTFEAP